MKAITLTFIMDDKDAEKMLTWANDVISEGGLELSSTANESPAILTTRHERLATEEEASLYNHVKNNNRETVLWTSDKFNEAWNVAAGFGHVDSINGAEYRRRFADWNKAGRPEPVPFIARQG